MKTYITLVLDDHMKYCGVEVFTTLEVALARAFQWAREELSLPGTIDFNENPSPEFCSDDGSTQWIVAANEYVLISVIEKDIQTSVPHFRGDAHQTPPEPVAPIPSVAPVDDKNDPSLPAGWDHAGRPIRMDFLISNPEYVKPTWELTENQQWALAIARISKRPNYSLKLLMGTFIQSSALQELKNRTVNGRCILVDECDFLDTVRESSVTEDVEDLD